MYSVREESPSQSTTERERLQAEYRLLEESATQAHTELAAECKSLKDSAAQARSELEGTAHILCYFLSSLLGSYMTECLAEFQARSLAQFTDL